MTSEYLAFAYTYLTQHQGPLCIFGHSLDESDRHITDAIRLAGVGVIAISVLPGSSVSVIKRKAVLIQRFPHAEIRFFDALTHPLGSPDLRIPTL